jgi:hypothetical protein
MDKEIIKVERGEFKITDNPNQSLCTEGLDSCVGLALVTYKKDSTKRGLGHLLYDGSVWYDNEGLARIKQEDKKRASETLEEIILKFSENGTIKPEDIRAYVVSNRTKEGKAKTKKLDDKEYVNPMFDFVINSLFERRINPVLIDGNFNCKREADSDDKRIYHIVYKNMFLHRDKINIPYYNSASIFLNPKTYSHPL